MFATRDESKKKNLLEKSGSASSAILNIRSVSRRKRKIRNWQGKYAEASLYGRFVIDGSLCPLGVAFPADSSRLQCKTTLRLAYLPGIKLHRRSRASTRVERRSALYRFTFITSNIDHVQRIRFIYATQRIVVATTTEIVSRFDQRHRIYFGFCRSLLLLSFWLPLAFSSDQGLTRSSIDQLWSCCEEGRSLPGTYLEIAI